MSEAGRAVDLEADGLWHAILARISEGVLVVRHDGSVEFGNAVARRLLANGADPLPPEIAHIRETPFAHIIFDISPDAASEENQIRFATPAGIRFLRLRVSSLSGSDGAARALLVFNDVTAQREVEDVRSEFVANVSHELRTPISILTGYIENLADFPKMPRAEQVEIFEIMQEHATRLKALLDDLLTIACYESHSDVLDYADLDLQQFLRRLAKDWKPALASKDMAVVLEVPDEARWIRVDRFRFEQVMHNLFDNAFKYTPIEGQIRVRASVVDDQIEISVEDNGAGIPEDDLPHIFERFYRVDKARSRKYGGTGLGLSIVKHIVALHGGTVRAESTLQMSTRIIISLPRAPVNR